MPCILPAVYILQCYVSYILQLTIGNIFLVYYNRLQVSKAEVLNFWRQREKNLCLKPQSSLFIVCYLKRVKMFALFCLFLLGTKGEEVRKVWFLLQRAFPKSGDSFPLYIIMEAHCSGFHDSLNSGWCV